MSELKAGRVLDIQIAKRLGWYYDEGDLYDQHRKFVGAAEDRREWIIPDEDTIWYTRVAQYSTDLNAAVKLWGDDYRWGLTVDDETPALFGASWPSYSDQGCGYEVAGTPALAICKAWIAWMDWKAELKA